MNDLNRPRTPAHANVRSLTEIIQEYHDIDTDVETFFEFFSQRAENIRHLLFDLGVDSAQMYREEAGG